MASAIAADLDASTFESVPRPRIMAWKNSKLLMNLGNSIEAACGRVAFLSAGALAGCAAPRTLLGEAGGARVAELTLSRPADAAVLARVAGVETVIVVEGGVRVRFGDAAALPALVALADTPDGALRTLRVRRPDLGDRFAELTGRTLEGGG